MGPSDKGNMIEMSKSNDAPEVKRFVVDLGNLPALFPTQRHSPIFWEALGRAIATFGFLEEMLGSRR